MIRVPSLQANSAVNSDTDQQNKSGFGFVEKQRKAKLLIWAVNDVRKWEDQEGCGDAVPYLCPLAWWDGASCRHWEHPAWELKSATWSTESQSPVRRSADRDRERTHTDRFPKEGTKKSPSLWHTHTHRPQSDIKVTGHACTHATLKKTWTDVSSKHQTPDADTTNCHKVQRCRAVNANLYFLCRQENHYARVHFAKCSSRGLCESQLL